MGFEYLDCGSGHGGEARCWPCPFGALPTGGRQRIDEGTRSWTIGHDHSDPPRKDRPAGYLNQM